MVVAMTGPEDKAHVQETSHELPPRAALLEGAMMVYRTLTTGDTVNAILLAEWLRDSVRERLTPKDAETRLVELVNRILGPRAG